MACLSGSACPAAHAARYGLYPRKGALVVGADADVAILDPARPWTIDASRSQSVAKWGPHDGMRLQGQIVTTLLRGMVVFDGHDVVVPPDTGRFVALGSPT
jgi:dihydroorotase-like cyclic amidohydrolase